MLKIKNGKVRCVGYNDNERYFTIGKIYNVIDNTIVDDTGFKYNHFNMESEETITEWLNTWYKFELVNEDKIVIIHDGKTTTATLYHGDEKIAATARCAPEDKFNFMVGANLAMERLNNEINKRKYYSGLMSGATTKNNPLIYYYDGEKLIKNAPTLDVVPATNTSPKLISVEDRLPENGQVVLCWYECFRFGNYNQMYRTYGIGYYFHGNWGGEVAQGQQSKVLAWMPLPEPPKES